MGCDAGGMPQGPCPAILPAFLAFLCLKSTNFTGMEITAFFDQVRQGDLEGVRDSLRAHPQWLGARDPRGSTPLILAAYYDRREVVKFLLAQGAPVDERDGSGNTALMGVCFKGYLEMAEILIGAGASVDALNSMGATCLIFAVTFNREPMARLLLEYGASATARDAQGLTALDHARRLGLTALVAQMENKT